MRCAFFPSSSVCPDFGHVLFQFPLFFFFLFLFFFFNFKNVFSDRRLVGCLLHKKQNLSLTKKEKKEGMKQSQNQEMQNESSPRVTRNQPSVTFGMESTTEFALVF